MKERLFFFFGTGGILILTAWAVGFFRRCPDAASFLGGALLLAGLSALTLYRLAVWRFPWIFAELQLKKFLKAGENAWILYGNACEGAEGDEEGAPEISFSLALEGREGMKALFFSGEIHPECIAELLEPAPGAELTAVFSTGTRALYLIGTAQNLEINPVQNRCRVQLSVQRARLSNRKREFLME